MNQAVPSRSDTSTANERLGVMYYSSGRYGAVLLLIAGIGIIAIFLLARMGIFGEPAPQLLYIGLLTLLLAVAQIPVLALAKREKGIPAILYGSAFIGIFSVFLPLFWQSIEVAALAIGLTTPVVALRNGLPKRYVPVLLVLAVVVISGILYTNANSPDDRLQIDTPAAAATIVFLIAIFLLFGIITFTSLNRGFRSLQSLLLTSFVSILILAIILAAALSAMGAYTSNQTQTFDTLESITTLKLNQISNRLADSQNDIETLLADPEFRANALEVLNSDGSNPRPNEELKQVARIRMIDILGKDEKAYNEIFVLDAQGQVVISSLPSSEGTRFQGENFFQQGIKKFYAGFSGDSFGTQSFIVSTPLWGGNGQDSKGVLALRSSATPIRKIMEDTPGFNQAETYFVDSHFNPITRTRTPVEVVKTQAVIDAIRNPITSGRAIYRNYAGEQVLGYYRWFPTMQLAVLAEIPLRIAVSNSLQSLVGTVILAFFVVFVAIIGAAISARTIIDPIKSLAWTTESFAAGKLSARAIVDRKDEIGALASAFNRMASQLQEMINKLEQRVANRTQDLENQTFRLRVAAEIVREVASARDLNSLLSQTADLIWKRFGFYHTAIFLLDHDREYAVLVASPTEAGRKMMEESFKIPVGDIGVVGSVAAAGAPRVILNTGADTVHFKNPNPPNVRSEMALPLKVEDRVIGVLDIQSDQLQAFSEEDITIMQILADQLATAIERTRLLQDLEKSQKELESIHSRFTSENWKRISTGSLAGIKGYRFDRMHVEPVTELTGLAETSLKTGTTMNSNGSNHNLNKEHLVAVPVRIRGKTIGVVNIKLKEGYDPSTLAVIESAIERLASSMESARLYEEARLRADHEQSISRVTAAISASTEYEQILQTTIKEIGSILDGTEVAIQILEGPVAGQGNEQRKG